MWGSLALRQREHSAGWSGLSLYEASRRPFRALVNFFLGTAPIIGHVLLVWPCVRCTFRPPPVILPGKGVEVHFSSEWEAGVGKSRSLFMSGLCAGKGPLDWTPGLSLDAKEVLRRRRPVYSSLSVKSSANDSHRGSMEEASHLHFSSFKFAPHSVHRPRHLSRHNGFMGTSVMAY